MTGGSDQADSWELLELPGVQGAPGQPTGFLLAKAEVDVELGEQHGRECKVFCVILWNDGRVIKNCLKPSEEQVLYVRLLHF